jgi:hypothetical protein
MVNRKAFLLLGIIFILTLLAVGFIKIISRSQPGQSVNFQLISDYGKLNQDVMNWLKLKEPHIGLYAYSLDNATPYKLIIFYNKTDGKNFLYITLDLRARLVNETLKINIIEEPAYDDSEVENRLLAYFQMKQKPKNIKVYLNEQPIKFFIKKGTIKSFLK